MDSPLMLDWQASPLFEQEVFYEEEERNETKIAKRSILRVKKQPLPQADSAGIDRWMEGTVGDKRSSRHIGLATTFHYEALENTELEAALVNYYNFELLDPEIEDPHAPKRARLSSIFFKEERSRTFDFNDEPQKVARSESDVKSVKSGGLGRPC
jgi:hypothetical protein